MTPAEVSYFPAYIEKWWIRPPHPSRRLHGCALPPQADFVITLWDYSWQESAPYILVFESAYSHLHLFLGCNIVKNFGSYARFRILFRNSVIPPFWRIHLLGTSGANVFCLFCRFSCSVIVAGVGSNYNNNNNNKLLLKSQYKLEFRGTQIIIIIIIIINYS